ncbi:MULTISPECIES: hypothetical protein [Methylobacteriaceae]|uniref:hypothetical protein n=1 Tax=Methylobacteriaceae TaxID=119045 RepID=UPI000CDAD40A|nr:MULTISPECIES: hypothetical protein [Methylobacteriaceae]MCP1549459.1 hypothetical protein [Methylorubrum zatmanii]MCP1553928.1 hypothetical protein [Methylorubrum extorquens]MCP1579761.1 hypothetical protein [Methylorubrum extorquens]POR40986.1 hypothetical protein CRT23_21070 [Methylobacterium sp. V23]
MRRRGEDTSEAGLALGKAASQSRAARRNLAAALDLADDARARAAIEAMMSDVERVARRADSMRLRLIAKAASAITDVRDGA